MLSLFADQEREAKLDSLGDPLALLDKHVDFAALAAEIDRWAPRPSRAKGGRPSYPTELMTRLLVLQQLFNLSDEQMEFQLLDRMSFQRFAGLKHSGRVPDRNTIWVFRERLVQANVEHQIFAGYTEQTVDERIRNAERDIAFLESPVQKVTDFECFNMNPQRFEALVHAFLAAQRLNVDLIGKDGKHYRPREWFAVSLEVAREVINRIIDGSITQYRMDNTTGKVVPKSRQLS